MTDKAKKEELRKMAHSVLMASAHYDYSEKALEDAFTDALYRAWGEGYSEAASQNKDNWC